MNSLYMIRLSFLQSKILLKFKQMVKLHKKSFTILSNPNKIKKTVIRSLKLQKSMRNHKTQTTFCVRELEIFINSSATEPCPFLIRASVKGPTQ